MSSIYRGRNTTEFYLASVLYDSIEDLNRSGVASLIKGKGADANIVLPHRGIAPFHLVIASENREFAMETTILILQHSGNPNVRSDEGLTPLHIAAAWGRRNLVELLLQCGADPDLQDNSYMTPIDYAKEEDHADIVQMIRTYVDSGIRSFFESRNDKDNCVLTLDKILVNNGQAIGEYEVVKMEVKQQEPIDLKVLPQTNPNEYVREWCNTLEAQLEALSLSPSENSDSSVLGPNYANVTTRRPVVNLDAQSSFYASSDNNSHTDGIPQITQSDFCALSQKSPESGIQTLPNSMLEEYDQTKSSPHRKDTSSDYCTCTDVSEVIEERDQNRLNAAFLLSNADMSFMSVSEVYKYTDPEEGVCLYEKRMLPTPIPNLNETENLTISSTKSSKMSSLPASFDYDTDTLRKELTSSGFNPGPITKSTKRVYLRKLQNLQKCPCPEEVGMVQDGGETKKVYSKEMQKTIRNPEWTSDLTPYRILEEQVVKQFAHPDPSRKWREGTNKASFTYLLLDPRITKNLPCRADNLSEGELWETFLTAIFYVGKGKRSRPYHHLYEAIDLYNKGIKQTDNTKLQRILDIWNDSQGVVCLQIFQNVIPVEAYTREAAMITALMLNNVENIRTGDFYGVAATWSSIQQQMLGVFLLFKALRILLHEGERQLSPNDIN